MLEEPTNTGGLILNPVEAHLNPGNIGLPQNPNERATIRAQVTAQQIQGGKSLLEATQSDEPIYLLWGGDSSWEGKQITASIQTLKGYKLEEAKKLFPNAADRKKWFKIDALEQQR